MKQLFNLQYFAEEASADVTDVTAATGVESPAAGDNLGVDGQAAIDQNSGDNGQASADNQAGTQDIDYIGEISQLTEDKRAELFNALFKSDPVLQKQYKGELNNALKSKISKATAQSQAEIEKYSDVFNRLSSIYGAKDLAELENKILFDDGALEYEAYKKGVPVETLKLQRQVDLQSKQINLQQAQVQAQQELQNRFNSWKESSKGLETVYPNFDFDAEFFNEDTGDEFVRMLESGLSVEQAYKVIHINDIVENRVSAAREETKKQTVDTIKARGMLPAENANSSQAPAETKIDINNLTPEQMIEINKKVARGESIAF